MRFSRVPTESKKAINRAGEALLKPFSDRKKFVDAITLVSSWRAAHAYPLNTFNTTLRDKTGKFGDKVIVAQRLKRMPTMIDKLRRFPNMQLTTMQDIGGVRAVMESIEEVTELANEYRDKSRFLHELVDEKDYISHPRDEDGYRSLHLMYKYRNKQNTEYDGLRIELQIRTKLQHTWATAVETMGTFLGQALKSRQGDKHWLDFFSLVSSAFAEIEGTPHVPSHTHMSRKQLFKAVAKANAELRVLERMQDYSKAIYTINKKASARGWSYHLIVLNSVKKTIETKSYRREDLKKAVEEYSKIEAEAAKKGGEIETVLVSAGPLSMLKKAYPNFFLDINDFVSKIEEIIREISD